MRPEAREGGNGPQAARWCRAERSAQRGGTRRSRVGRCRLCGRLPGVRRRRLCGRLRGVRRRRLCGRLPGVRRRRLRRVGWRCSRVRHIAAKRRHLAGTTGGRDEVAESDGLLGGGAVLERVVIGVAQPECGSAGGIGPDRGRAFARLGGRGTDDVVRNRLNGRGERTRVSGSRRAAETNGSKGGDRSGFGAYQGEQVWPPATGLTSDGGMRITLRNSAMGVTATGVQRVVQGNAEPAKSVTCGLLPVQEGENRRFERGRELPLEPG